MGHLSPQDQLCRNLCLNMADLMAHRPEVFRLLKASPADPRFQLDVTASGRPSIQYLEPGKPAIRLTEGQDPLAVLAGILRQLKPKRELGEPLALFGAADGYLLTALARHPVALSLGRQECVHLFEPNPGNLLLCLMIHNLSGMTGPIRQSRFHWWIGSDCISQFRKALLSDDLEQMTIPFPTVNATSPPAGDMLAQQADQVLLEVIEKDRGRKVQIATRAARMTLDRLIDATSESPSRKPRITFITTRFSTVLQYSTQDTAAAFRELGWETQVLIEPAADRNLSYPMARQSILDHDPDLVFQIDTLRSEHKDLLPPQIPWICWAQDHLQRLTSVSAGRSLGELDFFLTALGPWWTRRYDYPPQSMIPMIKLTKVGELPASWKSDGADLTYVSNASQTPHEMLEQLIRDLDAYPVAAKVARSAGEMLIEAYEQGESPVGTPEVQRFVDVARERLGVDPAEVPHDVTVHLFERIANTAYRQQALGWVADLADELGLRLELYGQGWEKHPRFARYNKGYVKYGQPLEELTRSSKINLQIVPYYCLHQRLLDGVAAGGFFLVRSHPADTALPALCRFVREQLPGECATLDYARRVLNGSLREELEVHAAANGYIADRLDAVELARNILALGLFEDGRALPAGVEETSFGSRAELRERVVRYLGNAELRRATALAQRESVKDKLSYTAGMRHMLAHLNRRLVAIKGARLSAA